MRMTMLATGAGVAALAAWATWHFADLKEMYADAAQTLCRTAVRQSLKSPDTFRSIDEVVSGSAVLLEFAAQNLIGAELRLFAKCEFKYLNGKFYLANVSGLAGGKSDAAALNQFLTAMYGGKAIEQKSTNLFASDRDRAVTTCLSAIVINANAPWPTPGDFESYITYDNSGHQNVTIRFNDNALSIYPRRAVCGGGTGTTILEYQK